MPRSLRAAFAAAILSGPSRLAGRRPAKPAAPRRRAPRPHTAKILIETNVFEQPGKHIKVRLPTHAQWGGGPHVLLVLDTRLYHGKTWLRVELPDRPNGSSGWIREDFVRLSTTPWRIIINRGAHTVTVYRDGQKQRSFLAVIGKPSTPTPRGLFAIYEKLPQPDPEGLPRPLGAASDGLLRRAAELRRRPGRVAIHGRDGTSLADPLGSSASHGCVRVDDANILWMARMIPLGTPVLIT